MHRIVNKYNAFKLNEYQGVFEIVSGNDNEGKFWMDWAIASEYDSDVGHGVPVKKDNGSYRNVPIKVVLGSKEQTIENLEWLLSQLREQHDSGEPDSPESELPKSGLLSDDDVPFQGIFVLGTAFRGTLFFVLGWGIGMTKEQLYEKALVAWGKTFEMDMLVKECAELIQAIQKFKRYPVVENVVEELADVEIMYEQMRLIFNPVEIDKVKEQKLKQLEEWMV